MPNTVTLTNIQRDELIERYCETVVESMDQQSLVLYAQEQMCNYMDSLSDIELNEEIDNHDENLFADLVYNVTNIKCESNNKNNVTYNEVDYVEQCITEGNDYRDCVDTLPGINDTFIDINNTGGKY